MVQESIDLACAELNEDGPGKLSLAQIADGVGEAKATVQGYVRSGRALVQEEGAVPVQPARNELARDGAPERIEA